MVYVCLYNSVCIMHARTVVLKLLSLNTQTHTLALTRTYAHIHKQVNPCSDASVVETKDMCAVMEKLPGVNVDNSLLDPTTQHEVSSDTHACARARTHTHCMHVCVSYIVCV